MCDTENMVIIRNLEKRDAVEVALLIPQLTKNIIESQNLVERIEGLSLAQNCQYLVAVENDKVVGFAGLVWYAIPSKGLVGWIEELVVDAPRQGQGIGRALMEDLLALAKDKKIKQVKLTALQDAEKWYEALGFTKKDHQYMVKNL